jgi:hypothetical protein
VRLTSSLVYAYERMKCKLCMLVKLVGLIIRKLDGWHILIVTSSSPEKRVLLNTSSNVFPIVYLQSTAP